MGTWLEMSHAVICIPVLSLPPMVLSQHAAVGSAVFGVAARQSLAAILYGLDPDTSISDLDGLAEIVDLNVAAVLASSGTVTALGAAAFAARLGQRPLRKANGIFMMAMALFMQWRDARVRDAQEAEEEKLSQEETGGQATSAEPLPTAPPRVASAAAEAAEEPLPTAAGSPSTGGEAAAVVPRSDFPRLLTLGSLSGVVLGFFGVGPAWLLAPILSYTEPDAVASAAGPANQPAASRRAAVVEAGAGDMGPALPPSSLADSVGISGSDNKTRTTACLAMVPPSIAAAWRHYQMGHVTNASGVALPLAAGAILGSAVGGAQLADVPCEEDMRYGVSILFFAHGVWSFLRP